MCPADAPTPPADPLAGRAFVATHTSDPRIVEGAPLELRFLDGAVVAKGGCNTQRGEYRLADLVHEGRSWRARLVVGPMMSTLMACDPGLMAQDRWIAELLADGPAMSAVDGQLTLRGAGGELALLEVLARD